jgi:adenosylmethionine-8-amino-7-oxononanoate aminotransferase
VASLKIFENEPVFERIRTIAQIHDERLAAIQKHPAVGNVRTIGSVAAIELHADDAGYFSRLRPKLYKHFIEAGVLLRPLGNIIYVLPPYVISPDDLNYVYDQIAGALDLCAPASAS